MFTEKINSKKCGVISKLLLFVSLFVINSPLAGELEDNLDTQDQETYTAFDDGTMEASEVDTKSSEKPVAKKSKKNATKRKNVAQRAPTVQSTAPTVKSTAPTPTQPIAQANKAVAPASTPAMTLKPIVSSQVLHTEDDLEMVYVAKPVKGWKGYGINACAGLICIIIGMVLRDAMHDSPFTRCKSK